MDVLTAVSPHDAKCVQCGKMIHKEERVIVLLEAPMKIADEYEAGNSGADVQTGDIAVGFDWTEQYLMHVECLAGLIEINTLTQKAFAQGIGTWQEVKPKP
jgi:hypothetical protein